MRGPGYTSTEIVAMVRHEVDSYLELGVIYERALGMVASKHGIDVLKLSAMLADRLDVPTEVRLSSRCAGPR